MTDVLKNPRVRELLQSLAEADRLRRDLPDSRDVDEAREGLLRDLGTAVYLLARTYGDAMVPVEPDQGAGAQQYTDELPGDDEAQPHDTDWYTSESPRTSDRLFDPGDLADDPTEIPESATIPTASMGESDDDDFEVETLTKLQRRATLEGESLWELSHADPTWKHHAVEFFGLLQLPEGTTADDLAVEASRVQWASSELERRLGGLPADVQLAFIGLLAARAHLLREHLDVDVGPRLALDRLDRFRVGNDLPPVSGLLATPRPERGTWARDARMWYQLLTPVEV